MIYAEAAYFENNACAHVAAWQDEKRLEAQRASVRAAFERRRRRWSD